MSGQTSWFIRLLGFSIWQPCSIARVCCVSAAGRVRMVRVGVRRRGGGGGPGAGGLAAGVPARPPPRAVALPHLQRRARRLAAPRL